MDNMAFSNELLNSYVFLLKNVSEKFDEMYEIHLNEIGLKSRHAEVILVVNSNSGISQKDIGTAVKKDRTTMVKIIDELEAMKLITRKTDTKDRRFFNIYLTENGEELYKKIFEIKQIIESTLLAPLSDMEKIQFKKTLIKIL